VSTPPYPDITVGDVVIHGPGYVGSGAVRVRVRVIGLGLGYYYMLIEGKVKSYLGYMLGRHKAPETSPTHLLCHFFGHSASLFLQLVSPTNPLNGP